MINVGRYTHFHALLFPRYFPFNTSLFLSGSPRIDRADFGYVRVPCKALSFYNLNTVHSN
jgi:hypothetical protein